MARIGVFTAISVLLNMFLSFWLINQYLSDIYFQQYVNGAIGQYYAFIVLTIGVGGGSGLGYLFLKKRHSDQSLVSRIQKSKSFKPVSPLSTTGSVATPRSILPTGAPPSPASKHTVYAVPPLPKNSSPSISRTVPSSTWSASSKSLESPWQKQETTVRQTQPAPQISKVEPSKPSSPFSTSQSQQPQPLRSIGEAPTRSTPSWIPQPSSMDEKRPESGPIFQKPGMDISERQESSFPGSDQPSPRSSPVPSKWAPPVQDKPATGQWPEGGVRTIPPLPTKWTPSSGSPATQPRPGPPPRIPPAGPMPIRGPVPPGQGGPRPFVIQGPGRPGEPRPIAAPRPFRPDPNRPPPGMAPQPRPPQLGPPQPTPRPAAPLAGPMPQPWTPPPQTSERKEPLSFGSPQASNQDETSTTKPASDQKSSSEGGGEMDWDTALDTILKTLRKDRVGDTK